MPHEFLHHLTQAPLPARVYGKDLIEAIQNYENQRLVVAQKIYAADARILSITVLRVTRAGRRASRQYLKQHPA